MLFIEPTLNAHSRQTVSKGLGRRKANAPKGAYGKAKWYRVQRFEGGGAYGKGLRGKALKAEEHKPKQGFERASQTLGTYIPNFGGRTSVSLGNIMQYNKLSP